LLLTRLLLTAGSLLPTETSRPWELELSRASDFGGVHGCSLWQGGFQPCEKQARPCEKEPGCANRQKASVRRSSKDPGRAAGIPGTDAGRPRGRPGWQPAAVPLARQRHMQRHMPGNPSALPPARDTKGRHRSPAAASSGAARARESEKRAAGAAGQAPGRPGGQAAGPGLAQSGPIQQAVVRPADPLWPRNSPTDQLASCLGRDESRVDVAVSLCRRRGRSASPAVPKPAAQGPPTAGS